MINMLLIKRVSLIAVVIISIITVGSFCLIAGYSVYAQKVAESMNTVEFTVTDSTAPSVSTHCTTTTTTINNPGTTQVLTDNTTAAATTTKYYEPYYYLSSYERDIVERVVMAEAGAESFEGQMAIAQCILNACLKTGEKPSFIVVDYQYAKSRPDPTDSVRQAVAAVFDNGEKVFDSDKVLFFYAPKRVYSTFHESQEYVKTIGGHKFFKEWD